MRTDVTKLLEIEYPILQGGMAWVAEHHLVAAVSEAGGLGLIGAASAPGEWVREQIRKVKERTEKPFGVNIMLMSPYADEVAKVVAEEGVKVVTTGAGNPEKYMKLWKDAGIKLFQLWHPSRWQREWNGAAQMRLWQKVLRRGDISEKTRRWFSFLRLPMQYPSQSLQRRNCRWARSCSILDAGASAVQVGTHFVVTKESVVHENYKKCIIKAKDIDSKVTGRSTGHPIRVLRNQMTKEYLQLEKKELLLKNWKAYAWSAEKGSRGR